LKLKRQEHTTLYLAESVIIVKKKTW
jgi:hypothetical protein